MPVSLLRLSCSSCVHFFRPPFTEGASSIFSCPVNSRPQACHSSPVTSSFCLWLLSEQLRPFKALPPGAGPLSSSLPSAQCLSFDIALPQYRTSGMLTDDDQSSPRAGTQTAEPQAPVLSSFQICCHYFIIVLISWLATLHSVDK